jgi:tetratricopeptide (TPR) repeat protein
MVRVRTPRRVWLLACGCLSLLAFTVQGDARAWAQRTTEPGNEAQLSEARRHFGVGVALYEKGDYANALTEFLSAYDTAQAATILYNIGLTYKSLNRYPEAIEALERYLGNAAKVGQLKSDRRRQVGKLIDDMKRLLSPVTFQLKPANAQLILDGRAVVLPAHGTLPVAVGPHVAVVSAEDHETQRREFAVATAPVVLAFDLKPQRPTGKIHVTSSQAGTSIEVNGQIRGLAPLDIELPAGNHQLFARREGFDTARVDVVLLRGQDSNVDLTLLPVRARATPVYGRWWFWTGVGAALAGGTAAALMLRPGDQAPLSGSLAPGAVPVGAVVR